MHDKKFMFFENYLKTVEQLPQQIQGSVLKAIIEYGLYGTIPTEPVAAAIVQSLSLSLTKSREYQEKQKVSGTKGGKSQKVSDDVLKDLLIEKGRGCTAKELAAAAHLGVSTIQKRTVWKEREKIWMENEKDFHF